MLVLCRRCYAYMQRQPGLLRRECLGNRRAKAIRTRAAARVAAGKHPDHNPPWTDVRLAGPWVPLDVLVAPYAVSHPPSSAPSGPHLNDIDDADAAPLSPE